MTLAGIASILALIALYWFSVGQRAWYRQQNYMIVLRLFAAVRLSSTRARWDQWAEDAERKFQPEKDAL